VNPYLSDKGIAPVPVHRIGATVADAPSSTENKVKVRDKESDSSKRAMIDTWG